MTRAGLAAVAAGIIGASAGTLAGLGLSRVVWPAVVPVERCPIVEYGYSPPVTMAEAVAGGRPSDGGRYAMRDCGTGVLVREWVQ